jgi:adenylate cyclase class IV
MHNLELKVRCLDEAALDALAARAAASGAVRQRAMHQRDTYFVVPLGRLKLREWRRDDAVGLTTERGTPDDAEVGAAGAVLIAYDRPDEAGSRLSDYLLSPVPYADTLRAALARALGTRVVVEKRRLLYLWGHTRIHFDRVAGLGAFVELETLLDRFSLAEGDPDPDLARQQAAEQEHRAVIAALGLDALPVVAGSYSDLLEATAGVTTG